MTSFVFVVALTAFLAGATSATFIMIVVGIRRADRRRSTAGPQDSPLEVFTGCALSAGMWPDGTTAGNPEPR